MGVAPRWRPTASTAAQRTSREPCLSVGRVSVKWRPSVVLGRLHACDEGVPPRRSSLLSSGRGEGGQGRARRPARRGSLDSPGQSPRGRWFENPGEGFGGLPLFGGLGSSLGSVWAGPGCGRPCLSRRSAMCAGCKMAFGVSRRTWCGRSFLVGCPGGLAATRLRELVADHQMLDATRRPGVGAQAAAG